MKTVGITYWSNSGNTENLANRVKEAFEKAGATVVFGSVDEVDRDAVLACDVLAFGSPAQGTEELSEDMQEFMDSIGDEIKDKPILLFGTYGWGGGAFTEDWKNSVEELGGVVSVDPIVCLEEPTDDVTEEIEAAVKGLLA